MCSVPARLRQTLLLAIGMIGISVSAYAQCATADLLISSGPQTATPSTVAPGETVTLAAWTIKNQGTASTGVGFNNGFYLSIDSVITASDTYITGNSNAALAAGASFTWGAPTLTIPANTAPGNYYIGILVDKDNAVSECSETNNYVNARLTVTCAADLVVSTGPMTATPATVSPGETVTLSAWTVKNQGTATTAVGISNGFYLSVDSVITSSDSYITGNSNAALGPGAAFAWGGPTLTIPANTPPGNYYIGILVNNNNAVCESSNANNYASTPITVGCGPDLLITSSLTANPTTVRAGDTITLSGWTVTNQGTLSTGVGF